MPAALMQLTENISNGASKKVQLILIREGKAIGH